MCLRDSWLCNCQHKVSACDDIESTDSGTSSLLNQGATDASTVGVHVNFLHSVSDCRLRIFIGFPVWMLFWRSSLFDLAMRNCTTTCKQTKPNTRQWCRWNRNWYWSTANFFMDSACSVVAISTASDTGALHRCRLHCPDKSAAMPPTCPTAQTLFHSSWHMQAVRHWQPMCLTM